MSEWQPIETCPERITVLLFAVTDMGEEGQVKNWRMDTGTKYPRARALYPNECNWEWGGSTVMTWDVHPTHWQPLPPPPTPSAESESVSSA